jgi:RNA polymerase sigma-70 factor, ECF subfamily
MESDHDQRAAELIRRVRGGDANALNELTAIIYPELKRRARGLMSRDRGGHTFGPTGSELVNRVMLKLLTSDGGIFENAETGQDVINQLTRQMRFILVDYARWSQSKGRPNPRKRVDFEQAQVYSVADGLNPDKIISIDETLRRLATRDPKAAEALELRYFGGLTNEEAADALGLSVPTFRRLLRTAMVYAKAMLERRAA